VAQRNADPLYDPTRQLAGQDLYASAKKITDAQIDPRVSALGQQMKSATTQGTALASRAGDYYKQMAADEMRRVAQQRAIGNMLNEQTAAVGAGTQEAFDRMGAAEQQRQASDTTLRGTGLGGDVSQVPEEIAAQRGTAATLQQGAANSAAQQGSEWSQLANAMSQSRQLRGGEVQGQLINRLANQQGQLRGQISDVESTRGDVFTKNLVDLRQHSFENLITQAGLNIKTADLQSNIDATNQRAEAATAKTALDRTKFNAEQAYRTRQLRIKAGRDPFTNKPLPKNTKPTDALSALKAKFLKEHGYLPPTGPPKPPKPGEPGAKPKSLSPAQQAQAGKQWSLVQDGLAKVSGTAAHVPVDRTGQITSVPRGATLSDGSPDPRAAVKTRPATVTESVGALRRAKTPEWAVQAILSIRHHGYILPSVRQMIAQAAPNLTIPAQYTRPPRRARRGVSGYSKGAGPD
jgi:hypothetical protein